MSEFNIPLHRVMLLQRTLEHGGKATCQLRRLETSMDAQIDVENDHTTHHIKVTLGPLVSSLALPRDPSAKYQQLRDFLQDLANGRADSGAQSEEALALLEAQESVNEVLQRGQIAYVITTVNRKIPLGAVVTNDLGEVCAAVTAASKEQLAAAVLAKLQLAPEALGECA
ncbi:hypothetical protein KC131_18875 [Pseudomonas sp. JQ170]|uniref:hypothetical protein n=1 Tax=unclassified Pseudomonas TaxID=196821 RepID=UPI0026540760|nr:MULTISPECIES: hypothetical protein [unclassified Pseudomonas]MDN7142716.1 hypothetical protein [Pseudomonas sp. JQ170]WRO77932.1 hypothetical protein U9R80_09770 [Pseudomonas sp. 170C]